MYKKIKRIHKQTTILNPVLQLLTITVYSTG